MKEDKLQQVYESFLQLENREDWFKSIEVNHIKIWHYIRYEIFQEVAYMFGKVRNPNDKEKFYEKDKTLKNWIDEKILKNQFRITQKDVLIFNHQRRVKQGNYFKCIYTDEWLKTFNRSYCVYELPYTQNFHFKPVKTRNLRYIDFGQYAAVFGKKYSLEPACLKEAKRVTEYLVEALETEFKLKFSMENKKIIHEIIYSKIAERDRYRDYYGYLLKRVKPKIILYVVGYEFDHMILAELANELNIPTVEIEHGHIGKSQLAYNFIGERNLKAFPDYLFVVGKHEIEAARVPIEKKNLYITGSPELDKKVDYYKRALGNKTKRHKIITFVSSGEYEIADAAVELYGKLDKEKYKIYLKLHPSEYTNWREKYRDLEKSGVCVADDHYHDIYYYLAVSNFLIGISSTVLFEATRFDCNILIYKRGYYYGAESLIQRGDGICIDSMDEAVEYICTEREKQKVSDYYYSSKSIELINNAIDQLISG